MQFGRYHKIRALRKYAAVGMAVILAISSACCGCAAKDDSLTAGDGQISDAGKIEEEPEPEPEPVVVDLMIFAGQSNMAGQGIAEEAPEVAEGTAYEYRAVTEPDCLCNIEEPFGLEENKEDGIYDIWEDGTYKKTGDLVPAFVNRYYELTGHILVAVSASACGTRIEQWLPGTGMYDDLTERIGKAEQYLSGILPAEDETGPEDNGDAGEETEEVAGQSSESALPQEYFGDYVLGNEFLIWCQGESDGDAKMSSEDYYDSFDTFVNGIVTDTGVTQIMVIRIGNNRDYPDLYDPIMDAQTRYCREHSDAVLISTQFAALADMKQMKDIYHYTQAGYDLVGEEAAENCASYVLNGTEPSVWDFESDEVYDPAESSEEE